MALLSMADLRNAVSVTIPSSRPYAPTLGQKIQNIDSFNAIPRIGLSNSIIENRILLYQTIRGERLYIQYPGIESNRPLPRNYPYDFKPVLIRADNVQVPDMDFKRIWDCIDEIGRRHNADIDILATVLLRMAYMIDYQNVNGYHLIETVDCRSRAIIPALPINLSWNRFYMHPDVMETLNDRFGDVTPYGISIEGFLYYNDLLSQNEDCKYRYLQAAQWNPTTGRINNCLSHLTVISHIRGMMGISKLIDSFQRTGVAPLPQNRFYEACGTLVQRV